MIPELCDRSTFQAGEVVTMKHEPSDNYVSKAPTIVNTDQKPHTMYWMLEKVVENSAMTKFIYLKMVV